MDLVSISNRPESPVIVKTRKNDDGKEIKQFQINPSMVKNNPEEFMSFQDNSKPVWSTPDGWKNYMEEHGLKKETGAIVRVKGQVVAKVNYDGSTTTRNASGQVYGNGMSERISNFQSRNPGSNVEIFEKGQGPTNAEVFEMFNGTSFKQYISEQYESMKKSELFSENVMSSKRHTEYFDRMHSELKEKGFM